MVIKVNEKGILYIDDVEKKITDLTSEFLENIVNQSLCDEVAYVISGDTPLANFFKQLQRETSEESTLRNSIIQNKQEIQSISENNEKLQPNYE